jgi:hypothetical protein
MATAYKILGQKQPSTSYETLYKAPESPVSQFATRNITVASVTNITVCNFSLTANRDYYIRVVPSGETPSDKHLLVNGREVQTNDTHFLPMKILLGEGDEVQVKLNSAAVVAFSAFGFEMY